MSTNDTSLALFLGSKTSPRMKAWMALPEAERRAKRGIAQAAAKLFEKHPNFTIFPGESVEVMPVLPTPGD